MISVFRVPVVVVVAYRLQQLHALGAVDHGSLGLGQSVTHKLLQPHAVHGDHVGTFNELHVTHGQGVVVQAAYLAGVQTLYHHAVHVLRHGTGQQIDRIGGGHHRQPRLFLLALLPPVCTAAGGQQEGQG